MTLSSQQDSPVRAAAGRSLILRQLGRQPYLPIWQAMQSFTEARDLQTPDEIWLLEHEPVFTQGKAGRAEHLLAPGDIPVVAVDRGGQVTYHGPGQLVGYLLVDLKRRRMGIKTLVERIEAAIIDTLATYDVVARTIENAPGVYVAEAKIASLGLRVSRGCSFHGLALNLDMDLEPFSRINPCGYQGLQVIQLKDLVAGLKPEEVSARLAERLVARLEYDRVETRRGLEGANLVQVRGCG